MQFINQDRYEIINQYFEQSNCYQVAIAKSKIAVVIQKKCVSI